MAGGLAGAEAIAPAAPNSAGAAVGKATWGDPLGCTSSRTDAEAILMNRTAPGIVAGNKLIGCVYETVAVVIECVRHRQCTAGSVPSPEVVCRVRECHGLRIAEARVTDEAAKVKCVGHGEPGIAVGHDSHFEPFLLDGIGGPDQLDSIRRRRCPRHRAPRGHGPGG